MKKIYILTLLSISLSAAFGQLTLTYQNNGPLPGDSSRSYEIAWVDPGNSGENQVWNFSGIQYTGKTNFYGVTMDPSLKMAGPNEKSLILGQDGYDYKYTAGIDGYRETGYIHNGKKLTLAYSSPVVRMKFPLSYGQQFSNPFSGVALFADSRRIELGGEYTVTADASGTLILPDRILSTLRVKTIKQYLQTSVCGSIQSTVIRYCWFAPGYRYPVLTVSTTENISGGNAPVMVKEAWINVNQQSTGSFAAGVDPKIQVETGENSVIVFPNPFTEQVTYNYFLRKQLPVMVELYDMSGKFNIQVEKKQLQAEGLHTGTLNASVLGLPPGVYYLRFIFDKQSVVSKIVKI